MPSIRFNKEDNVFIIKSGALIYLDTLENMQADSGLMFPALPVNIKHYYYNQSKSFAKYSDGESETDAPLHNECDLLIDSVAALIQARADKVQAVTDAAIAALTRDQKRQNDILSVWPVAQQLEALTENLAGRPGKLNQLQAHIASVKLLRV